MTVFALSVLFSSGCAPSMGTTTLMRPFNVVEAGIPELQKAMAEGRVTSRQLVVES